MGKEKTVNWAKFVQETINLVLPEELNTTDYTNGSGYIQLSIATHAKFLLRYREVIENTMPEELDRFDRNPGGFIGRILNDSGSVAYPLWGRTVCIDSKLRMWGQAYFVANPDQAKQVCLAYV